MYELVHKSLFSKIKVSRANKSTSLEWLTITYIVNLDTLSINKAFWGLI